MSERQSPYWIGNVTRVDFSPKAFRMTPDPVVSLYADQTNQANSAEILEFSEFARLRRDDLES